MLVLMIHRIFVKQTIDDNRLNVLTCFGWPSDFCDWLGLQNMLHGTETAVCMVLLWSEIVSLQLKKTPIFLMQLKVHRLEGSKNLKATFFRLKIIFIWQWISKDTCYDFKIEGAFQANRLKAVVAMRLFDIVAQKSTSLASRCEIDR